MQSTIITAGFLLEPVLRSPAKPAGTGGLRVCLGRTRESSSPPRGLLPGCVDVPLKHFSIKKRKEIAIAGQVF